MFHHPTRTAALALLCSVCTVPRPRRRTDLTTRMSKRLRRADVATSVQASMGIARGSCELTDEWFIFAGYTDRATVTRRQDYGVASLRVAGAATTTCTANSPTQGRGGHRGFSVITTATVGLGIRSLFDDRSSWKRRGLHRHVVRR